VQNRSRNIEPKRSAPDLKLKDREAPLPDPQREAEHELLQRSSSSVPAKVDDSPRRDDQSPAI
jgi:hypothetical protein